MRDHARQRPARPTPGLGVGLTGQDTIGLRGAFWLNDLLDGPSDKHPPREAASHTPQPRRTHGELVALDAVYGSVLVSLTPQGRDSALVAEILQQLDVITQERRARLAAADGTVPGVIWPVLFWGAAVTVGFTFFFGTQNLLAQSLMTGLLSVVIFSGLLIVVLIDRPFSGAVTVTPDALAKVLAEFGTTPATQ